MIESMPDDRFYGLERILAQDPAGRGIAPLVVAGDLERSARTLLTGAHVVLVTGFFIPDAGACETDGPPGAIALALALERLGIGFEFLTDEHCHPVLAGANLTPLSIYDSNVEDDGSERVLVAIERPGRSTDGSYRNMRGRDISAWTAPIDNLFLEAGRWGGSVSDASGAVDEARPAPSTRRIGRGRAVPIPQRAGADRRWTIGIGDGGNEIGMGKVYHKVAAAVPNGKEIASIVATDHLIVAGTSNWGAWGLVAGLALLSGRDLLPDDRTAKDQLERFVAAGAVDGVTGRPTATVDGLDSAVYFELLDQLRRCLGS